MTFTGKWERAINRSEEGRKIFLKQRERHKINAKK